VSKSLKLCWGEQNKGNNHNLSWNYFVMLFNLSWNNAKCFI
jgi:hypothetical protein